LYISPSLSLRPITLGGTGTLSEILEQPEAMPMKYEKITVHFVNKILIGLLMKQTGSTGTTGATGATGDTGATGVTGPPFTPSFALFYSETPIGPLVAPSFTMIPWDVTAISTEDISASGTSIQFLTSGIYELTYFVNVQSDGNPLNVVVTPTLVGIGVVNPFAGEFRPTASTNCEQISGVTILTIEADQSINLIVWVDQAGTSICNNTVSIPGIDFTSAVSVKKLSS
jgi:hypothetical protein